MNFCPMWAAGSTSQLADFPVLAGIECLTILADNDENEASVDAASTAYWRWKDAGRDVRIRQPKERGDLNDIIRRVRVNENARTDFDPDADPLEEVPPKPRRTRPPPPGDAKKDRIQANPLQVAQSVADPTARIRLRTPLRPEIPLRHRRPQRHRQDIPDHRQRDGNGLRPQSHRRQACPPVRVWYWNGEDPHEEIERRIAATCIHYKIGPEDIEDRLFFDSGRDTEIIIASQTKSGALIATPIENALTDAMIDGQFDVLILDPFVSTHRVNENDNMAIDAVAKTFGRIAENANCAIELIHHVRKTNGQKSPQKMAAAPAPWSPPHDQSASSTTCRRMRRKAGIEIDRRRFFFRSDIGKANLAPPSEKAAWHNLASVPLGNGDRATSDGDIVGVVTAWEWPNAFEGVTATDLRAVQAEVRNGRWRENSQANDWVGIAVAKVLKLDPKDKAAKAKIRALMKTWIENGMFAVVTGLDENER